MVFKNARLKLTLWYLVIIMTISVFFSIIVYRGFTKELGRGFKMQSLRLPPETHLFLFRRFGYENILPFIIYPEEIPPKEYAEIISFLKKRFAIQLLIINLGILVISGSLSYFLAGKTLQPIEEMVERQKRFVADASHEFRTPLTSMKTEIEVALRDKKLTLNEAKRILESNLSEVDKLRHFTDSLLTLSLYESNSQNLSVEKVDLKDVALQGIERNILLAKKKRIRIRKTLEKVIVKGSTRALVDLFSVLINNAIKFSPEGKEIKVSVRKTKNAEIKVIDQGVGIAEEDLPHIFDRFWRADLSRNKKEGDGYGLGLSIAKSIVDSHRGKIEVISKLGKGSTFKVILPL